MRPGRTTRWRKYAGILVLGFLSLGGVSLSSPGRQFLHSARSFVHYYQALEQSGVPTGFWERVVFSLVLASADSPGPESSSPTPMSSS
jgi:hypothetical protein